MKSVLRAAPTIVTHVTPKRRVQHTMLEETHLLRSCAHCKNRDTAKEIMAFVNEVISSFGL
eukprot:SAG31_NODE_1140_length_9701_cov_43.848261_4_plen_61_part_00